MKLLHNLITIVVCSSIDPNDEIPATQRHLIEEIKKSHDEIPETQRHLIEEIKNSHAVRMAQSLVNNIHYFHSSLPSITSDPVNLFATCSDNVVKPGEECDDTIPCVHGYKCDKASLIDGKKRCILDSGACTSKSDEHQDICSNNDIQSTCNTELCQWVNPPDHTCTLTCFNGYVLNTHCCECQQPDITLCEAISIAFEAFIAFVDRVIKELIRMIFDIEPEFIYPRMSLSESFNCIGQVVVAVIQDCKLPDVCIGLNDINLDIKNKNNALLIIDVQECFLDQCATANPLDSQGAEAVTDSSEIISKINRMRSWKKNDGSDFWDLTIFSLDTHPSVGAHISFASRFSKSRFGTQEVSCNVKGSAIDLTPNIVDPTIIPKCCKEEADCDCPLSNEPGPKCKKEEQALWLPHCREDDDNDLSPYLVPPVRKSAVEQTSSTTTRLDYADTETTKFVRKGQNLDVDASSAFFENLPIQRKDIEKALTIKGNENGELFKLQTTKFLKEKNIDNVFVVGISTDYSVKFSAIHSRMLDFTTILIKDAAEGVFHDPAGKSKEILEKEHYEEMRQKYQISHQYELADFETAAVSLGALKQDDSELVEIDCTRSPPADWECKDLISALECSDGVNGFRCKFIDATPPCVPEEPTCDVTQWSEWADDCTNTCGEGTTYRTRDIAQGPTGLYLQTPLGVCPHLTEERECQNTEDCPTSCTESTESIDCGQFSICERNDHTDFCQSADQKEDCHCVAYFNPTSYNAVNPPACGTNDRYTFSSNNGTDCPPGQPESDDMDNGCYCALNLDGNEDKEDTYCGDQLGVAPNKVDFKDHKKWKRTHKDVLLCVESCNKSNPNTRQYGPMVTEGYGGTDEYKDCADCRYLNQGCGLVSAHETCQWLKKVEKVGDVLLVINKNILQCVPVCANIGDVCGEEGPGDSGEYNVCMESTELVEGKFLQNPKCVPVSGFGAAVLKKLEIDQNTGEVTKVPICDYEGDPCPRGEAANERTCKEVPLGYFRCRENNDPCTQDGDECIDYRRCRDNGGVFECLPNNEPCILDGDKCLDDTKECITSGGVFECQA